MAALRACGSHHDDNKNLTSSRRHDPLYSPHAVYVGNWIHLGRPRKRSRLPLQGEQTRDQSLANFEKIQCAPTGCTFWASHVYKEPGSMRFKIVSRIEPGDLNMAKIGRNDLCLCGSGKKYKKCCLSLDEAKPTPPQESFQWVVDTEDPFILDSNRVVDLINEGKLDKAERLAEKLLTQHPEHVDGLERLAMVN